MSASKSKLVLDVNNQNFQTLVVESSKNIPILVDFWAPWCGPCRDLTPVLEKLVVEFDGTLVLAKVNIDENQETSFTVSDPQYSSSLSFSRRPVDRPVFRKPV